MTLDETFALVPSYGSATLAPVILVLASLDPDRRPAETFSACPAGVRPADRGRLAGSCSAIIPPPRVPSELARTQAITAGFRPPPCQPRLDMHGRPPGQHGMLGSRSSFP